jgi:hypothetical protein
VNYVRSLVVLEMMGHVINKEAVTVPLGNVHVTLAGEQTTVTHLPVLEHQNVVVWFFFYGVLLILFCFFNENQTRDYISFCEFLTFCSNGIKSIIYSTYRKYFSQRNIYSIIWLSNFIDGSIFLNILFILISKNWTNVANYWIN